MHTIFFCIQFYFFVANVIKYVLTNILLYAIKFKWKEHKRKQDNNVSIVIQHINTVIRVFILCNRIQNVIQYLTMWFKTIKAYEQVLFYEVW
jgi:predicted nucleic acid-binding protein